MDDVTQPVPSPTDLAPGTAAPAPVEPAAPVAFADLPLSEKVDALAARVDALETGVSHSQAPDGSLAAKVHELYVKIFGSED